MRTKEEYIKAAIARYGSGDIDFDPDPEVHDARGGVWVTALVWVPDEDDENKEKTDD